MINEVKVPVSVEQPRLLNKLLNAGQLAEWDAFYCNELQEKADQSLDKFQLFQCAGMEVLCSVACAIKYVELRYEKGLTHEAALAVALKVRPEIRRLMHP